MLFHNSLFIINLVFIKFGFWFMLLLIQLWEYNYLQKNQEIFIFPIFLYHMFIFLRGRKTNQKETLNVLIQRKTEKTPRSIAMPTASMWEYAFGLVKARFHALTIFSQRYRKRYRLASREEQSLSHPSIVFPPPLRLLPVGQWGFDKSPPFPGDRNPKGKG